MRFGLGTRQPARRPPKFPQGMRAAARSFQLAFVFLILWLAIGCQKPEQVPENQTKETPEAVDATGQDAIRPSPATPQRQDGQNQTKETQEAADRTGNDSVAPGAPTQNDVAVQPGQTLGRKSGQEREQYSGKQYDAVSERAVLNATALWEKSRKSAARGRQAKAFSQALEAFQSLRQHNLSRGGQQLLDEIELGLKRYGQAANQQYSENTTSTERKPLQVE